MYNMNIFVFTPFMTVDMSGGGAFSFAFPKSRFIFVNGTINTIQKKIYNRSSNREQKYYNNNK